MLNFKNKKKMSEILQLRLKEKILINEYLKLKKDRFNLDTFILTLLSSLSIVTILILTNI